jgi:hypothetical protein
MTKKTFASSVPRSWLLSPRRLWQTAKPAEITPAASWPRSPRAVVRLRPAGARTVAVAARTRGGGGIVASQLSSSSRTFAWAA